MISKGRHKSGDFMGKTSLDKYVPKAVARDGNGDTGQFSYRPELGRVNSVEKCSYEKNLVDRGIKRTQGSYAK